MPIYFALFRCVLQVVPPYRFGEALYSGNDEESFNHILDSDAKPDHHKNLTRLTAQAVTSLTLFENFAKIRLQLFV